MNGQKGGAFAADAAANLHEAPSGRHHLSGGAARRRGLRGGAASEVNIHSICIHQSRRDPAGGAP
jgi:hypothetical protein